MIPIEISSNRALLAVLVALGINFTMLGHENGTVRLQVHLTPQQDEALVRLWESLTELQYRYLAAVNAGFVQGSLWSEPDE
jgi:hypothetical protein